MNVLALPYRWYRWMMYARPIRFTRFGTFYILFAIGVGAAAINTGNNLLYLILGMLLGFIVISGFLSDSGLWGVRTTWSPVGSLYVGENAAFECRASKGWFPAVGIAIQSVWQGLAPVTTFFPWIPARGSVPQRVTLTPKARGLLRLESCRYSTHFPFGLFRKSHTWSMDETWTVYPRILPLPHDLFRLLGKEEAFENTERQGRGSVPFVLRDYRTGDALRQVDWKASAKRTHLIVKEMEEEASRGDLYVLSAWPVHLDPDAMERFISFTASLIFAAYENGRPVGLAAPGQFFPPELSRVQLHRILEFLALVEPYKNSAHEPAGMARWRGRVTEVLALWLAGGNRYGP